LLKVTVSEEYKSKDPSSSGGFLFQFLGATSAATLSLRESIKTALAEQLSLFRAGLKNTSANKATEEATQNEVSLMKQKEDRWKQAILTQFPEVNDVYKSLVQGYSI
jgi:hypothetical protein